MKHYRIYPIYKHCCVSDNLAEFETLADAKKFLAKTKSYDKDFRLICFKEDPEYGPIYMGENELHELKKI